MDLIKKSISNLLPSIFLVVLIALVFFIYAPGVSGDFFPDDIETLSSLGSGDGVIDFNSFKVYVFGGHSGPLGRPISLASFLIDDNAWPSSSLSFKETNLKLHVICGLLVIWSALLLLRHLSYSESTAVWIALVTGSIWMLHPLFVSTTLYVVQRMAQLAAIFMLIGCIIYLYGRSLISSNKILAHGYMSAGVVVFCFLAAFSKENGLLLPLIILCLEVCLPQIESRMFYFWKIIFLIIPSLAIAIALLSKIEFSLLPWVNRPYTQYERFLTEFKVLSEYIYHLLIPQIENKGFFNDGYRISTGILTPIATLWAMITIAGIFISALVFRKRYPLFSIAVLTFLAGHLMESTWLNLELYFEHRNYASSIFLFLPLAACLISLQKHIHIKLVIVLITILLAVLSILSYLRVGLWASTARLNQYTASAAPESPRARNWVGAQLYSQGRKSEALNYMINADNEIKTSSLLTLHLLYMKLAMHVAVEADFRLVTERLKAQSFDSQSAVSLREIVKFILADKENENNMIYISHLFDELNEDKIHSRSLEFLKLSNHMRAKLNLALKKEELAFRYYQTTLEIYNDIDPSLTLVVEVANSGHYQMALKLLQLAENKFTLQKSSSTGRSYSFYKDQIDILRAECIGQIEMADKK